MVAQVCNPSAQKAGAERVTPSQRPLSPECAPGQPRTGYTVRDRQMTGRQAGKQAHTPPVD